jgi:hypothetical protein
MISNRLSLMTDLRILMSIDKAEIREAAFNPAPTLPFNLRTADVKLAMQDVYDFFFDVNTFLIRRNLPRLEDSMRRANFSGLISDALTASVAKHSRSLTANRFHNGHPDLIVAGTYPNDSVRSGAQGVEIKATMKRGGSVDTHGARDQWMMVFVYACDRETEPAQSRSATKFTEIYLANVSAGDFRKNERGELGTRTATLDRDGITRLREGWLYLDRN